MKISRLEYLTVLTCAVCLAFGTGWFVRGETVSVPMRVETSRTLAEEQTVLVLPQPAVTPDPLLSGEKIDINTADEETLMLLPGIGEKRAKDIIAYRAANGPFRIPEDLTKVKGIGEETLEGLLEYITAG